MEDGGMKVEGGGRRMEDSRQDLRTECRAATEAAEEGRRAEDGRWRGFRGHMTYSISVKGGRGMRADGLQFTAYGSARTWPPRRIATTRSTTSVSFDGLSEPTR